MKIMPLGLACVAALWCARPASGLPVKVSVQGTVEFNFIGGSMAGVADGSPVEMSFLVDSDTFVDSPNFPTRGYPLDLTSFDMTVDGNPVNIIDPQPFGSTAYFVLRDNDPAVDGVFLSRNIEFPLPVGVTIPGLAPDHELDFLRTFDNDTVFPSLDILDAVGTYGLENLSSYDWSIGVFGNDGAFYAYESFTIEVVPEPAALAWLSPLALMLLGVWGARARKS